VLATISFKFLLARTDMIFPAPALRASWKGQRYNSCMVLSSRLLETDSTVWFLELVVGLR
jgi:hypothetical protein